MDAVINIRTDKKVRDQAKKVFSEMGLSTSAAINLFLRQAIAEKGLPFNPTRDPEKLRKRWDAEVAHALKHGKRYKSAAELFRDIA
jgi:DNA-damage-inducible protein J